MSRTGDAYMEIAEREYEKAIEKQRNYYYQIYGRAPYDDEDIEINEEDAYFYEREQEALRERNVENNYSNNVLNTTAVAVENEAEIDKRPTDQKGWNEYNEDTTESTPIEAIALDFVNAQAKLEILETNDWWLSVPVYDIEYQLNKLQQINLIEEYILRCLGDKELGLDTIDAITDILKIDKVFVQYYLKRMLNNGQIIKTTSVDNTEKYDITDEGKKTLETGQEQVAMRNETVSIAYKPSLEIQIYNQALWLGVDHLDTSDKLCSYETPFAENDELTIGDVNEEFVSNISEAQGKEFAAAGLGSTVFKINSVKNAGNKYFHYGEVWIYDALNREVFGKIWDFQQERWVTNLEIVLPAEKKQKLLEDYNNRVEEERQKQLKTLLSKQASNNKTKVIETLRGLDIRTEFLNCFTDANKELIIISPWINDYVVDAAMLKRFQNVVDRGVALYIGWGIAKNIEEQDKKPSEQLMKNMKLIVNKNGYPGVYIFYIGNHHDKEVLVDEKYHMLGSFNWLSYRGEHNIRHESVNKIYDKGYVLSQRKVLEKVFFEVLERELINKQCFTDENSLYRWIGAVINLKEEKKARTELIMKAINELEVNNPEMLKAMLSMYNKCKLRDFGFDTLKEKWNTYSEKKKEEAKKNMVSRKELIGILNCSNFDLLKLTKMIGIKNISAFSKEDAEKIIEAYEKLHK